MLMPMTAKQRDRKLTHLCCYCLDCDDSAGCCSEEVYLLSI